MDEPTKRAWSKPELIVVVRGGPEEAVLTACKDSIPTGPQNSANWGCSPPAPCTQYRNPNGAS